MPRIVGLPVTEKKKRGRGHKGFDQGERDNTIPKSAGDSYVVNIIVANQAGVLVRDRSCISVLLATSLAAVPYRERRHSRGLIITGSDSRWDSGTVNQYLL